MPKMFGVDAMACIKCGKPTFYTPLLDSINFKLHKLFHCWECLWEIGKYTILASTPIPRDRWDDITIDTFRIT